MKKRLNVLVSTTTGWNQGDDWIRMGCINILRNCTDQNINILHFDRNQDLRVSPGAGTLRTNTIGNYLNHQSLDYIDFVFLAGTPQWFSGIMTSLFQKILVKNIPVLALGLGSLGENFNLAPHVKEIFHRENTFVSCRAKGTAERLNQQIGVQKAVALPCPAVLSSLNFIAADKNGYAQVVQTDRKIAPKNGVMDPTVLDGLDRNYPVICQHVDEWEKYTEDGFDVIHNPDPASLQKELSRFSKISSTRLHGAIASISLGTPAILVSSIDYRLNGTAKMFGSALPVAKNFAEAKNTQAPKLEDIKKIKEYTLDKQSDIVTKFLNSF